MKLIAKGTRYDPKAQEFVPLFAPSAATFPEAFSGPSHVQWVDTAVTGEAHGR